MVGNFDPFSRHWVTVDTKRAYVFDSFPSAFRAVTIELHRFVEIRLGWWM